MHMASEAHTHRVSEFAALDHGHADLQAVAQDLLFVVGPLHGFLQHVDAPGLERNADGLLDFASVQACLEHVVHNLRRRTFIYRVNG